MRPVLRQLNVTVVADAVGSFLSLDVYILTSPSCAAGSVVWLSPSVNNEEDRRTLLSHWRACSGAILLVHAVSISIFINVVAGVEGDTEASTWGVGIFMGLESSLAPPDHQEEYLET
jgi:hypothetical protein